MNDDAGCKYVGMIFFFGTGSMYRINNIDAKNAQNPNSHFTAKSDRIYKSKLLSSSLASTNRLQKLPLP